MHARNDPSDRMPEPEDRVPPHATPGHALEQVFEEHFDGAGSDPAAVASRTIHVFQCGMISEAALMDLLSESERRSERR